MTKQLEALLANRIALSDQAELIIFKKIEILCKKNKWYFNSISGCVRKGDFNGEEIENTEIAKLVEFYERHFDRFTLCVCDKGKWIEGETGIIKVSKPY